MKLGILALTFTACASTEHVRMDPVVIQAGEDPLTPLAGYDAEALLDRGNVLFEEKRFDDADRVYARLLEVFPESEFAFHAAFNRALCDAERGRWALALQRLDEIVSAHPNHKKIEDALFRRAVVLAKLERWAEVAEQFWALRQRPNLNPMEELEARTGFAVARFMAEDYATAEVEFLQAISFFEKHEQSAYLPADYYVGQSRFYLGEIAARKFEGLALSIPETGLVDTDWATHMGASLEEKCEILLRAQNNFIRAIRVGHAGWATASGYRIGSLYERLYDDLLKLPVPESLSDSEGSVYREELLDRVRVLVEKAIQVYERSLRMATRVGESNEWVAKTEASLERLKALYLKDLRAEEGVEPT